MTKRERRRLSEDGLPKCCVVAPQTTGSGVGRTMNYTTAQCGCLVVAEGAPGSLVRQAQESRHCGKPRCRSRLPAKFSDDEVESWCYLHSTGTAFSVNIKTRDVLMIVNRLGMEMYFPTLIKAAEYRKQQCPEEAI